MQRKHVVKTTDSASLWNYTLSPGWTTEEVETLRHATMKFGVGNWTGIMNSGCLPGKTRTQLNLQLQRIMGQQSLGEFMGIRLDAKRVFEENSKKSGVSRKNGYIINTGNNQTKEERREKIKQNREIYEIPEEQAKNLRIEATKGDQDPRLLLLRTLRDRLQIMESKLREKMIAAGMAPPPAAAALPNPTSSGPSRPTDGGDSAAPATVSDSKPNPPTAATKPKASPITSRPHGFKSAPRVSAGPRVQTQRTAAHADDSSSGSEEFGAPSSSIITTRRAAAAAGMDAADSALVEMLLLEDEADLADFEPPKRKKKRADSDGEENFVPEPKKASGARKGSKRNN